MGGSALREKHSSMAATDQEHHNSDIDEECTTKKEIVASSKSVTPMTADTAGKTEVVGDTQTATLTATLDESEEELIKATQKNSKRTKLIDE